MAERFIANGLDEAAIRPFYEYSELSRREDR